VSAMASTATRTASSPVARARDAGDAVAAGAGRVPPAVRTAGLAMAGLAGGIAIGAGAASRRRSLLPKPRPKVLGVPIGRKPAPLVAAKSLAGTAKQLGRSSGKLTRTAEDIHEIRRQLEQSNRRSPIEVVLDGLTHRRGVHRDSG